jgi:hypothetical protein
MVRRKLLAPSLLYPKLEAAHCRFCNPKDPNLDTRGRENLKFSKLVICTYLGPSN